MLKKLRNDYYHVHKRAHHHTIVVTVGLVFCAVMLGNILMSNGETYAQWTWDQFNWTWDQFTWDQFNWTWGQWNMESMFSSLTVRLSNSWAIGSWWNMILTLQNDKPNAWKNGIISWKMWCPIFN